MINPTEDTSSPTKARRRWFAGLVALGSLSLLGAQTQARGWGHRRNLDLDEMVHRLDDRIGRMVTAIGGTPQQKDRLVAIATAALADLRPIREQVRQSRRKGLELLAAPVIDKAGLEQLRATQMQAADASSRRTLQALTDAAEVLTPEQRAKWAERLKARMEHRWHG